MVERRVIEWEWNRPGGDVMVFPPPPRVRPGRFSDVVRGGQDLVDVSLFLRQLRWSFLSDDERIEVAKRLRASYLHIQRLASVAEDSRTRRLLTKYLVVVGSLGVIGPETIYSFLEAIAADDVVGWVDQFYRGAHAISQRNGAGEIVTYAITEEWVIEERASREEFLLWLEEVGAR